MDKVAEQVAGEALPKRILCLDTSAGTQVALVDLHAAQPVLGQAQHADPRGHAENVAPLVKEVLRQAGYANLAQAQLDLVAVGRGPAPFTGLRAGLATARVMAQALGVKVIGLCSLAIVARQVLDLCPAETEVIVTSDARRKEIYLARYRAEGPDRLSCLEGPLVGKPAELVASYGQTELLWAGEGIEKYPEIFSQLRTTALQFDVSVLARLAADQFRQVEDGILAADQLDPVQSTAPLYLRRPDVQVPKRK